MARHQCKIREVSIRLCETSNFSILTFSSTNNLKICMTFLWPSSYQFQMAEFAKVMVGQLLNAINSLYTSLPCRYHVDSSELLKLRLLANRRQLADYKSVKDTE